eukprot:1165116-Heterocapsa_arctica.AAC.1
MPPPAASSSAQGWHATPQWEDQGWTHWGHADPGAHAPASATPPWRTPAAAHTDYQSLAQARTSTNIGRNGAPRTSFQHGRGGASQHSAAQQRHDGSGTTPGTAWPQSSSPSPRADVILTPRRTAERHPFPSAPWNDVEPHQHGWTNGPRSPADSTTRPPTPLAPGDRRAAPIALTAALRPRPGALNSGAPDHSTGPAANTGSPPPPAQPAAMENLSPTPAAGPPASRNTAAHDSAPSEPR